LKYNNLLKDVVDALGPKLGSADYKPEVNAICQKLRSFSKAPEERSRRPTPRFLRIIATHDDKKKERLNAEKSGDVGFLRWECVEKMFPDVVWNTSPSVD
jgi:hypothetical protein